MFEQILLKAPPFRLVFYFPLLVVPLGFFSICLTSL
nr:MAG TPA: hypothetical protein [Caudoviricetes sp.]